MYHIQFNLTQKEYKKNYVFAMSLYYLRIYAITLTVGLAIVTLIGKLFKSKVMVTSPATLLLSFIPTLFVCWLISLGMSWFDARKTVKSYPGLTEGSFKVRFERTFMVIQKDGKNDKLHYDIFRFYRGLNNSFVLYDVDHKSIVIPGNLLTKEQCKEIKAYVKGR